ncbi:MAG: homocysteine S-methyltransferase family protein [Clostridia bacterium]|nr:homocysteine S-methyltransferase family protein [Clostridia bacterium]
MNFRTYLKNHVVLLDGAMGTQIQKQGLPLGAIPESIQLLQPDRLIQIHKDYVASGSKVVSTNTFGASPYKLKNKQDVKETIEKAIACARETGAYVALDLGPTGQMMEPIGPLTFDEAYESYKTQVLCGLDADLVLIETMSDLNEVRAAVLAVKENSDLPVIVSMTFQEDGRTLTGVTAESYVLTMEGLGVDGLGVNCSLGPDALMPIVKEITDLASVPVIVQANAGLPEVINGETVFQVSPTLYSQYAKAFVDMGVRIIGGCCGTGPEHIKAICEVINESYQEFTLKEPTLKVCSQRKTVDFNDFVIIGERINPTGNKKLKASLRAGDLNACIKEGIIQGDHGIHVLDVNVGLPDIDELDVMIHLVDTLSHVVDVPLQIDSSKSKVLEAGLRRFPGIGIINSVNGKEKSMEKIFPIAKKYGAFVICLTMDEEGIPHTYEKRVEIAEKIISSAESYGISREKLIIDTLVLTVSAQQKEVMDTIKAIERIHELGLKTTLGISNVSYGMPNRKLLTRTFMTLARAAGLSSAIMDPLDEDLKNTILATDVLLNLDPQGERYIHFVTEQETQIEKTEVSLYDMVLKGFKDQVKAWTIEQLNHLEPLKLVDEFLIPTLDEIGLKFEQKILFLPQLIRAAETIGVAFDVIKSQLESDTVSNRGSIIMATVKGDVHDIGKNLVKILLENYGFNVIDLGKDVEPEKIVESAIKHHVKLVGLSALMTTTVVSMEETIQLLKEKDPSIQVFVGGAVLTESYSKKIKADYYCKDAKASVEVAKRIFDQK